MKIGDIVRLIVGGPWMIVEHVVAYPRVEIKCVWFAIDEGGGWVGPHRSNFIPDLLEQQIPEGGTL